MAEPTTEMFPIPPGVDQDEVMSSWEQYNQLLTKAPDQQAFMKDIGSKHVLFDTFNKIKQSGADVEFDTDVEIPGQGGGASLALRLIGATGQGLGALTANPVGVGAGMGFNWIANSIANQIDSTQGEETEAVPFSGLVSNMLGVENPMTTGNPLLDATAESSIDALTGIGVFSKMGKLGELGQVENPITRYVADRLDPKFLEDYHTIGGSGNIPLSLRQKGVGGSLGDNLARIVGDKKQDAQLAEDVAKGLENTWRNVFKLDLDNPQVTDNVLAGFNKGVENGRQLSSVANLSNFDKSAVVNMTKFMRGREKLFKLREGYRMGFVNSTPNVAVRGKTATIMGDAVDKLNRINILGESGLENVVESIKALRQKVISPKTNATVKDAGGVKVVLSQRDQLLQGKDAGFTILDLINDIDDKIANLPGRLPPTKQNDAMLQLQRVRDSLEADIYDGLNDGQRALYDKYRKASNEINSYPTQLVQSVASGEFTGFMETIIKDRASASNFLKTGAVTEGEARSMLGEYLLQKGKKVGKDGAESLDFGEIMKFVSDPKNREGVSAIMGNDNMHLFKQFANVAQNVAPMTRQKGALRNVLAYSPAGMFYLSGPVAGTTGMVLGISANTFLKKVLFNPKVGREAIEMLKTPSNSRQAKRAYGLLMSALNGHEAAAIYMDQENTPKYEQQIVIRNREGGDPIYSPINPE